MIAAAFDRMAAQYDRVWTHSSIGQLQREAVWRSIGPLFMPGLAALDLGCGTGEDGLAMMRAGLQVRGIDASPEMVRIARERGVDAEVLAIENCGRLDGSYDVVLSNFGALNCVKDLENRWAGWFAREAIWRSASWVGSACGRQPGRYCAGKRRRPSGGGAGVRCRLWGFVFVIRREGAWRRLSVRSSRWWIGAGSDCRFRLRT
jgi:SAM-dependent methyltransferase